jgi:type IV secretion system protein VirD4
MKSATCRRIVELLFLAAQRPIIAGKLAYYADAEFRGLYDAP